MTWLWMMWKGCWRVLKACVDVLVLIKKNKTRTTRNIGRGQRNTYDIHMHAQRRNEDTTTTTTTNTSRLVCMIKKMKVTTHLSCLLLIS